ncbi:hypothetical protein BDV06DRAFT_42027 [Aspergillus oleicola]
MFTPTILTELSSLTTSSTITTEINGQPVHSAVGPGVITWDPVATALTTSLPDFAPFPFPAAPPAPAEPSSSIITMSPEIYPSAAAPWPLPPVTTIKTSIDGSSGSGLIRTTITGTTNSDGAFVLITALDPEGAISSPQALFSELGEVSAAIFTISSITADCAKATAALEKIKDTQEDTNDFDRSLSISGPSSSPGL